MISFIKKTLVTTSQARCKLLLFGLTGAAGLLFLFDSATARGDSRGTHVDALCSGTVSTDVASGTGGNGPGHNNPADFYCLELGYEVGAVETEAGQHGICIFPNGSSCDSWDFFEGKCGEAYSYCVVALKAVQITKDDGQDPYSRDYAVCVDPNTGEEIGSITALLGLLARFERTIHYPPRDVPQIASPTLQEPGPRAAAAPPAAFDWRNHDGQDWMTSVKNQSQCGSCWAFSAVGITEAVFNIDRNNPDLDLDLSEEELNSDASAAGSCCGGWHDTALNYIQNTGIPDEPCLPYDVAYYNTGDCSCYPNPPCNAACTGLPGSCSQLNATDACADVATRLTTIADYGAVPDDEEQIKEELIERGPLAVCLAMSGRTDAAGVYRCTACWDRNNDTVCDTVGVCAAGVCISGIVGQNCTSDAQCDEDKNNDGVCNQNDCGINHCVVLVGYDDGGGYWIAKNSWGATWGVNNNGYWEVGYGECHIEAEVYYAEAGDTPNQPPMAEADGPYSAECQGATTAVAIDGTGSSDPDPGDTLTYAWTTTCPGGSFDDASSPTPTLTVDTSLDCVVLCEVSLTVDDGEATDRSSSMVTIEDTAPPDLTAPADITAECTSPAGTAVALGTPAVTDICDPSPAVADDAPALFPLGTTGVTWSAMDRCGNTTAATQDVTVLDTIPPELAVSVMPDVLWPPNHKMTPVNVVASVSDICDGNPACRIVSISSNEPADGQGDGHTAFDWEITGDLTVNLRAERSGGGGGRVYTITVECSDASGNSSTEATTVSIPHDKGKK